jgi:hypothetical protein
MYFRVKRTGSYAYLQIVESFREQLQVRQRVLSTVGRLDTLQASGQLDTCGETQGLITNCSY